MSPKVFLGLLIGAAASVLMQVGSQAFSLLACAVHFYLFFSGLVAVSLYGFFSKAMQKEFWNLLFDYMAKMIQYFLVLFIGSVAALRYIYSEDQQKHLRSDILYSGTAVLFSFMMVLYWVMVPAWTRLVDGYAKLKGSPASPKQGRTKYYR